MLFVYRENGRWGSVARSRDPGLHGRKPVFRTARALALSYVEPYVDFTGRITGYAVVDLRMLGHYDWRLSERNVWKAERLLLELPAPADPLVRPAGRPSARALLRVQTRNSRAASPWTTRAASTGRELPRQLHRIQTLA